MQIQTMIFYHIVRGEGAHGPGRRPAGHFEAFFRAFSLLSKNATYIKIQHIL